jgi:hypothetical protein
LEFLVSHRKPSEDENFQLPMKIFNPIAIALKSAFLARKNSHPTLVMRCKKKTSLSNSQCVLKVANKQKTTKKSFFRSSATGLSKSCSEGLAIPAIYYIDVLLGI